MPPRDIYGSIRLVIEADGKVIADESHPSNLMLIQKVGKGIKINGEELVVMFEFDPPVSFPSPNTTS